MPWMGVDKMKKHWRNLVARYGAYPVVWSLAGEWTMAFYVRQKFPPGTVEQVEGWVELDGSSAAGIPGEIRLIYIPRRSYQWSGPKIKKLKKNVTYRAFYFNPATGKEYDLGTISNRIGGEKADTWQAPWVPLAQDWVLVLEKVK